MKQLIGIAVAFSAFHLAAETALAASSCGSSATQNQYGVTRSLSAMPNLTPRQCEAAVAVETACARLNNGGGLSLTNPEQLKLFNSCARMVHTARAALGLAGAQGLSLGLSAAELANNLEEVDPGSNHAITRNESVQASGGTAIQKRLGVLHLGAAGGGLADSTLHIDGRTFSLAELFPRGVLGGSAGDGDSFQESGWGGFVNGEYSFGNRDATGNEPGFDIGSFLVTAGADYRLSTNLALGAALTLGRSRASLDASLGDIEDQHWGLSLYASAHAGESLYLDAYGGYAKHNFDSTRNIFVPTQTATSSFSGTAFAGDIGADEYSASLEGGAALAMGAVTITPYGRVNYLRLNVDDYTESETAAGLALSVQEQKLTSLQSALGVRIERSISSASGVFIPQVALQWNHEFDNDDRSVTARYVNENFTTQGIGNLGNSPTFFNIAADEPDRDFFNLSAGLSAIFAKGRTGFLNFSTVLGLRDVKVYTVSAGLRFSW